MKWASACALVALVASRALGGPSDHKKRADALFDDGRRYLTAKEYALACTAFEQSQEADPAIGTALNIALCYEEWGHIAAAYRAYVEAERLAKAKNDNRAKGARKKIDELAPRVPRLHVAVPAGTDPAAVFLLDGKEIERTAFSEDLQLEVGPHTIEARVPGKPPIVTRAELHDRERKELTIDLPLPAPTPPVVLPPPPRRKGRLYGGIGLAVAGVGTFAVASALALSAQSDYNNAIVLCPQLACETHAAYEKTQDAIHRANLMTFVAGGGIALVGAGVVLIVTSGGKRAEPAKTSVAPLVAPGVAGVAVRGSL